MLNVRKATETDLNQLVAIQRELQSMHLLAHPGRFTDSEDETFRSFLLAQLISPVSVLLVALSDTKVCGYALASIRERQATELSPFQRFGYVDQIVITKEKRKGGLGQVLMLELKKWAKSRMLERLELNVFEFNSNAQKFFSNQGFEVLDRRMVCSI